MTEPIASREIELRRTYDAPRAVVFSMWTEAAHLAGWWGPEGFSAPHVESDPHPGGALVIEMAGQGMHQTMRGRYREVVVPERLVVDALVPGPGGSPIIESTHTVTFAERGDRTDVVVRARASVFMDAARAALEGMRAGWNQSLQRLDDVVTGAMDRQLVFQRLLDGLPEDVFSYWIDQDRLAHWWAGDGTECPTALRFDEIVPGERLVYSDGEPSGSARRCSGVVMFDEMGGRTVLSMRLVFDSASDRDLAVEKDHRIEAGNETLARLEVAIAGEAG